MELCCFCAKVGVGIGGEEEIEMKNRTKKEGKAMEKKTKERRKKKGEERKKERRGQREQRTRKS